MSAPKPSFGKRTRSSGSFLMVLSGVILVHVSAASLRAGISFTLAGGPLVVSNTEFFVGCLTGLLAILMFGWAARTIVWARRYAPLGAVPIAGSREEAELIVHLSPDERALFETVLRDSPRAGVIFAGLFVAALWASTTFLGLYPLLGLLVGANVYLLVYTVRKRRRCIAFLAATNYAKSNGISADSLRVPFYRTWWMNTYYREVLPELDPSPFEDE